METYPSIARDVRNEVVYCFDKLDGSSGRAEWTRKKGFCKYGTRTQMIDETSEFGTLIGLFKSKYEKELDDRFRKERWEKTTCFFEYWSPNTFAGLHADEPHTVTLFDVKVYKKGFMLARDFLRLTDGLDIAKLLYHGNANSELVDAVRSGTLQGMTYEGVVCKGPYIYPGTPLMFKIKNQKWIDRLRERCKGNQELFEKLV